MALFKRRVFIYSDVLPAFVKFQTEKKIDKSLGFFDFPKCYFAEYNEEKDDSVIIMEDLKENGYKMWNKAIPTNYEHAKLVVAALGKLHAVSFAMKTQRPEIFAKYKELGDYFSDRLDENFVEMLVKNIDGAAETIDESDHERREKVLKLKQNIKQTMIDCADPKLAEPFAVVAHGDCWSNNFMYQYETEPSKIVLLDWQVSRYCSPVLDLVYFFFVCTDREFRSQHYDEFLKIYYRSLQDLLDSLGGDTKTQFPFTSLHQQLKQFGKYGVIMSTLLIPMMATKSEELPDMDFIAENMNEADPKIREEMTRAFSINAGSPSKPRMEAVVLDANSYEYL